MTHFGSQLRAALDTHGPLCVGIDPHLALLADWGLDASAAGVREFGLRVVDAAAGRVGVVKPQVGFFEPYGSAGIAALEEILAAARAAGLLVIADAKRGDIGSTMDGYAAAWLGEGSTLAADAVTVSPFLGVEALSATFRLAQANGRGVFVLAATSNSEGARLQRAAVGGTTVARDIVDAVSRWNDATTGDALGDIGVVIGATLDRTAYGIADPFVPSAPILAPGFGAQGAEPHDVVRLFGSDSGNVVASESRSILSAGPHELVERITARAEQYRSTRG